MTTSDKKVVSILLASSAVLALAGCGKGEDKAGSGAPQSVEEVAKEMDMVQLQPGEWETTTEMVDMKIEGAPEGMPADAMKGAIGHKTSVRSCITPEQAAKPNADFVAAQKDSKCTYSDFAMVGGTIKGTVSCPGEQGGKMTASMNGSYQPTSYALTMTMNMDGIQPGMKMVSTMKTTGKRIGDCPAG